MKPIDFVQTRRPGLTTRFVTGYTVVLAVVAGLALTVDFAAKSGVAGDSIEIAAVSPTQLAPVAAAALGLAADGTGTFSGVVLFDGNPPTAELVVKKGDATKKDAAVCAAQDVPSEELVINKDNKGIANVFIYLDKAPAGAKFDKAEGKEVVFDQMGCRFLPHALVAQAGQKVMVKSGDPIGHNTHTSPLRNNPFNQVITANDRVGVDLKYVKAEKQPIEVKCDFHPWMKAYHLILDHPYMAVTDADGKFTIADLPPGKHEFKIWHEKKGYLERKYAVEVKPGETTDVKLSFDAAKFAG
ncbi:MAG: hypothetical protein EXS05_07130 [Planctomycetaceae bacterium]|nr:hypothetical protein [Planctomycetaceae bacterium]